MELTRLAGFVIVIGGVILTVGVGFYDWRAGLVVFGLLLAAAGIQTLRSPSG